MQTMTDLVRRFRGQRVLIVGDVMLDSYFEGTAARLCTEGPVPVVRRTSEIRQPGGAANTAANIASLGAEARLVGLVGPDDSGRALRATLRDLGVSDEWLVESPAASTLHKLRIMADGQYVVRFDEGDTSSQPAGIIERLLEHIEDASAGCDAILVSDYVSGAIGPAVLQCLSRLRMARDIPLVVDSKDLLRFANVGATVVTPNLLEARVLLRKGETADYTGLADEVLDVVDAEYAAITLGKDGVLLAGRDGVRTYIPTHPVQRANDVGAGDTFASALTLALSCQAGIEMAVEIGIDAAAIAITRPHTATVEHRELLQQVSLRDLSSQSDTGTVALESLRASLTLERAAGKRIIFTNGVFDILHAGHVEFLRQAKDLGDVLVVAVNSDQSARNLKGRNRPINSQRDRLALIAALGPVDYSITFDDATPTDIIRMLRPDVHVKGGDHSGVDLPEAAAVREYGGEVVILPLVGNVSTTSVIDRILSLAYLPPEEAQVALD